jgi:hypothetical protein
VIKLYGAGRLFACKTRPARPGADAWRNLQQEQLAKETSIGAAMEHLHSGVLDQIIGAHISFDTA